MARRLNPIARHRERCRDTRKQLSEYFDGELDAAAAGRLEQHLRWCPNCRRMLTNLRRTVAAVRSLHVQAEPFAEHDEC